MPELTNEARLLLDLLQRRSDRRQVGGKPRWARTLAIARWLDVRPGGSPDSRKRGVRKLVEELRAAGVPVMSSFAGIALEREAEDHQANQDFRRRMGLRHMAAAGNDQHSQAAADASGQFGLFGGQAGAA